MRYFFNSNIKLILSENVCRAFEDLIYHFDFNVEIGGILIGERRRDFLLSSITFPAQTDISRRNLFIRKSTGHQEIMDREWVESGYQKMYLGEWHTHNESYPRPSCQDLRNWKNISRREHQADILFFIIVGLSAFCVWAVHNGNLFELVESNRESI